jgi:ABC-2 type transport system ATP-binding protein
MSEELENKPTETDNPATEKEQPGVEEAVEPQIPLAVEINNLTKRYNGRKQPALENFSLKVPDGQVLGLIGANGAGKTTALKILATLLPPTAGEAFIKGLSVTRDQLKIRRIVGFMPDNYGLYDDMQVAEYLEFFASCYGIRGKKRTRLINELLQLVDLSERRREVLSTLSRGMRQRLCLAHTLIHDPQVLLLDEPASGLDPRSRAELRELLRELSRMGKTVIISSHVLGELEDICEAMGIMQSGKLVAYGLTADVVSNFGRVGRRTVSMRVLTRLDLLRAIDAAKDFPDVIEDSIIPDEFGRKIEVEIKGDDTTCAAFLSHVTAAGVNISQFSQSANGITELL